MIFINVSNHPAAKWDAAQVTATGVPPGHEHEIIDVPFPAVDPAASEEDVARLADETAAAVRAAFDAAVVELTRTYESYHSTVPVPHLVAQHTTDKRVLVQGEFSLCAELWPRLAAMGFVPVVATSARESVDLGDGKKAAVFKFVKFRRVRV